MTAKRNVSLVLFAALWLTGCGSQSQTTGQTSTYGVGEGSVLRGATITGPVNRIAVERNSATMFKKEVASKCRPIKLGSEGIPSEIAIGDTVRVKGHEIPVKIIMATRPAKSDMGICHAYETSLDMPTSDVCVDALWIEVRRCRIIEAPELQFPPGFTK